MRLDARTRYVLADGCLHGDGTRVPLTRRERALLELLLNHRDRWLSKEWLVAALYAGQRRGGEESLKSLLLRLRRKLGAGAIENRYGLGYRLAAREPARVRGRQARSGRRDDRRGRRASTGA